MMMSDMAHKLKGMGMEISEGFLVHFIMTSLPVQFGPFKINYNTQKDKWQMSELIAMCVQEEERLKVEKPVLLILQQQTSERGREILTLGKARRSRKGMQMHHQAQLLRRVHLVVNYATRKDIPNETTQSSRTG